MSTIKREDGLQLVISPYREILNIERTGVLKRKIRLLARQHGLNIRIFKHFDGRLEVVFSRDSGFLLGETVWNYLHKPNNLILCEALSERRTALLVVIRDGVVFMDAKVSFTELTDEFASLSTTEKKYDIYVYGDVPLKKTSEGNEYVFDDKLVNSFTILEEPLLNKLPVYEIVQLQPLELALTSPLLGKSRVLPIVVLIVFFIGIMIGWHFVEVMLKAPVMKKFTKQEVPVDPYLQYYSGLMTPSPREQINEIFSMTRFLYSLPPGWNIDKISYNGSSYSMQAIRSNGSIGQIRDWAKANNIPFSFSSGNLPVNIPSNLKNRPKPNYIYPMDDLMTMLMDEMNIFLRGKGSISFSGITNRGSYKDSALSIKFNNASLGTLMIIGSELDKFPASISAINLSIKDNSFSGDISFKVFGD